MRCHICDSEVENLEFNQETKKFEPCRPCIDASQPAPDSLWELMEELEEGNDERQEF